MNPTQLAEWVLDLHKEVRALRADNDRLRAEVAVANDAADKGGNPWDCAYCGKPFADHNLCSPHPTLSRGIRCKVTSLAHKP